MCDTSKYFCPRLLDYLVIAGCRSPNGSNHVSQTPELLRRYPLEDHQDFPLPNDVIFFCQPEGCISVGPKSVTLRETTSFVFTLTEKDTGLVRYGICINFYRPFGKRAYASEICQKAERANANLGHSLENMSASERDRGKSPNRSRRKTWVRNNTLTSLCVISHHPFFSTFRECLFILRRIIEACHDRSCVKRVGGSKVTARDSVWGVLTGQISDNISSLIMHEVREIETWILRLLSAPVPVPGKTRVEVHALPSDLQLPLLFALPDSTRFGLVDFPLHLPLELLGVDTCLKALTAIMLEHKVILQSRDYNALTMSVMAFVSMLYPLEYMFPLLLAPTPYLIGVPASFLGYKKDFPFPDDIWLVDLDGNKILSPSNAEPLPPLPEPEGSVLKTHLRQALASMSMAPQPIKNLDALAPPTELWPRKESLPSSTGFNPLIYGNDVDSVDVATRVAMVRFFNSPNTLGNFTEHTRTLRLYPRPVVAFQLYSFLRSRPEKTTFTAKLARTQAVEYLSEWALSPTNHVFQRIQTGVYDPSLIGDKAKWYAHQLQRVDFHVYDNSSSLGAALTSVSKDQSDNPPTDESGSDSDGADSNSSSYSSLSDFVSDLFNSDIRGETPYFTPEMQILAVDESQVYSPPSKLLVPDAPISNSDSALSLQEDSDMTSSVSSDSSCNPEAGSNNQEVVFRYDSGNVIDMSRSNTSGLSASPAGLTSAPCSPQVLSPATLSHSPKSPAFRSSSVSPGRASPSGRTAPPVSPGARSQRESVSSDSGTSTRRYNKDERSSASSKIFTLGGELADLAHSATSSVTELFAGGNKPQSATSQARTTSAKPFSPLGNRKALVEKSGLAKHAASKKLKDTQKPAPIEPKSTSNSENQQFLKEVINSVLEGRGLGWMKGNRINKLMEDENYRNFVVSRLNRNLDKKVPEDASHMEDVCVSKPVFKGMLSLLKAIIHGLGHTISNHGLGGMASAYMVLEIAHTHCWARELSANKPESKLNPEKPNLHGSHDSLEPPGFRKGDESSISSEWWHDKRRSDSQSSSSINSPRTPCTPQLTGITTNLTFNPSDSFPSFPSTASGSPMTFSGSEIGNVEITSVSDDGDSGHSDRSQSDPDKLQQPGACSDGSAHDAATGGSSSADLETAASGTVQIFQAQHSQGVCDITVTDTVPDSRINQGQGDMLRDMVRNKELIKTGRMDRKFNSEDSEMSEASTLVSTKSERQDLGKKRQRINHQTIRAALSDSEMETTWPASGHSRRRGSNSIWNSKSTFSTGYRYHEGKLVHTGMAGLTAESAKNRTYLFEGLVGKDRSRIWDNMQFWEDMFLDAVAQERDIIGMDQSPSEMMERYTSLTDVEKRRLELDEDKLLALMLYNQTAFMLMMRVTKVEIKKKIRRLLGKSHVGLQQSQEINNLLDNIQHLYGNDIDLKPMCSRRIQRLSYTVHWGVNNQGDMLFMEVYDDCLLLRNVTGAIHDRWWFEKIVNITYCPKTRVLCLWRTSDGKVQLNQFYTKKCRELYFSVREAMGKAASRKPEPRPGLTSPVADLGGEYPVQCLKTKESGILKVCMEGIGLLLQNSK
ncbi:unnamed protein product, partial [Candidula unifasciata]